MVEKDAAKAKLQRQLDATADLTRGSAEFKKWHRDTELAIQHVFGAETRHVRDFDGIRWTPSSYRRNNPGPAFETAFARGLESAGAVLASMIGEIDEYWSDEPRSDSPTLPSRVEHICSRFHVVARQLRERHNGRATLDVDDEYDVQDLMHALLRVDFEDVRAEEWTPGYAGKAARMDFLLKDGGVVIEVKRASRALRTKELGDQLIIDIARYRQHPDCKRLICFIYDPEGIVGNPATLETDLSKAGDGFAVQVIVAPR